MPNHTFTDRLREAIEQGPAKQKHIAHYCGISEQAVGKWKRGRGISRPNLEKLAQITGYEVAYLMTGYGPKKVGDADSGDQAVDQSLVDEEGYLWFAKEVVEIKAVQRLLNKITVGIASRRIDEANIDRMSDLIESFLK